MPASDRPSRRAALITAGVGGLSLTLAGCGIRLERNAPRVPGIPTAPPPADTTVLLATIGRLRSLVSVLSGSDAPWASRLVTMHAGQLTRTISVAASYGVDVPTQPALPTPAAATTSAIGSEVQGYAPAATGAIAAAESSHRPMLTCIAATQAGAASLLGYLDPSPTPVTEAVALIVLPALRTAVYALQTVAAKTPSKQRATINALLKTVGAESSRAERAAGTAAPPAPLTYPLPIAPTTPDARTQLVRRVLADGVQACAYAAGQSGNLANAAQVTAIARLWGVLAASGWTAGTPVTSFPGLHT